MSSTSKATFIYLKPRIIKAFNAAVVVLIGVLAVNIMDWLYEFFNWQHARGEKQELIETGMRAFVGIVGLIIVVYSVILIYRLIVVVEAYSNYK